MNNDEIAIFLEQHDIRPTAVRILVWRTLLDYDFAFALADLEGSLPTVDRSTLFRALTLFAEKEMLHIIDDGSGQHKYCVCLDEDNDHHCDHHHDCHHHDLCQHVHFTCTHCGRTFCIKDQHIPLVPLPKGFVIEHVNYIVHGICSKCSKR